MPVLATTNLDYLIDQLRLHLGDINHLSYRYLDEWLRTSLMYSVKSLQRWWNFKYLIDENYNVYRNPNQQYLFPSPPIIQQSDEQAIILMASIITKGGSLEANAWNVGSWRDAELAYSNIEGAKQKDASIKRDLELLYELVAPPRKRLAWPIKQSLPGYIGNSYERKEDE